LKSNYLLILDIRTSAHLNQFRRTVSRSYLLAKAEP